MEVSLLLDFLTPREVANTLMAGHENLMDHPIVLYNWIYVRMKEFWSALPPSPPPSEYLNPHVLLELLERLHIMSTYNFQVRFDCKRCSSHLRIRHLDNGSLCRTTAHGSVFGDQECTPNTVSFWRVTGISTGCSVGIAQELDAEVLERYGFAFGQHFETRPDIFLSKQGPACNLLPAIMYTHTGIVTTGDFRGPRLSLPCGVRVIQASPINPTDIVDICVDLWKGKLMMFLNEKLQVRITLDVRLRFVPVFSCQTMTSSLFIHKHISPPWHDIYDYLAFQEDIQSLGMQSLQNSTTTTWTSTA